MGFQTPAAGGGHAYFATEAGLFLSGNMGDTWSRVGKGILPENISCVGVSGNSLFAGTAEGVFRSWDNGVGWTTVNQGLEGKNVTDMTISGDALYIGRLAPVTGWRPGLFAWLTRSAGQNRGAGIRSQGLLVSRKSFSEKEIGFKEPE